MNNLSWLIYVAEVLPGVAGAVMFASMVSICVFVYLFAYMWTEGLSTVTIAVLIVVFLVITLVCSLVPSKGTIYLIAGSEAGEYVVSTEAGQEIVNDVREIISYQLKQLKENN